MSGFLNDHCCWQRDPSCDYTHMQSAAHAGGASSDALSLRRMPTTAFLIFHVLSPLLRLLNQVPRGSVHYGDRGPVFLYKCELECREYLGTFSPPPGDT